MAKWFSCLQQSQVDDVPSDSRVFKGCFGNPRTVEDPAALHEDLTPKISKRLREAVRANKNHEVVRQAGASLGPELLKPCTRGSVTLPVLVSSCSSDGVFTNSTTTVEFTQPISLLHIAVQNRHPDMIRLLLSSASECQDSPAASLKTVQFRKSTASALHLAAVHVINESDVRLPGSVRNASLATERTSSLQRTGSLQGSASQHPVPVFQCMEMFEALLKGGVSPDEATFIGFSCGKELRGTLLHYLCFYSMYSMPLIRLLIQHKADVNAKLDHSVPEEWQGATPLHMLFAGLNKGDARQQQEVLAITDALLAAGADCAARCGLGLPLSIAVAHLRGACATETLTLLTRNATPVPQASARRSLDRIPSSSRSSFKSAMRSSIRSDSRPTFRNEARVSFRSSHEVIKAANLETCLEAATRMPSVSKDMVEVLFRYHRAIAGDDVAAQRSIVHALIAGSVRTALWLVQQGVSAVAPVQLAAPVLGLDAVSGLQWVLLVAAEQLHSSIQSEELMDLFNAMLRHADIKNIPMLPMIGSEQFQRCSAPLFIVRHCPWEYLAYIIINSGDSNTLNDCHYADAAGKMYRHNIAMEALQLRREGADVAAIAQLLKTLVDHGVSVAAASEAQRGATVLHVLRDDQVAMAKYLVKHGCNVNAEDVEGNGPLAAAAAAGQVGVVRVLLMLGADLARVNHNGESALHCACRYAHAGASAQLDIVRTLVKAGSSISLININKQTALDVARANAADSAVIAFLDDKRLCAEKLLQSSIQSVASMPVHGTARPYTLHATASMPPHTEASPVPSAVQSADIAIVTLSRNSSQISRTNDNSSAATTNTMLSPQPPMALPAATPAAAALMQDDTSDLKISEADLQEMAHVAHKAATSPKHYTEFADSGHGTFARLYNTPTASSKTKLRRNSGYESPSEGSMDGSRHGFAIVRSSPRSKHSPRPYNGKSQHGASKLSPTAADMPQTAMTAARLQPPAAATAVTAGSGLVPHSIPIADLSGDESQTDTETDSPMPTPRLTPAAGQNLVREVSHGSAMTGDNSKRGQRAVPQYMQATKRSRSKIPQAARLSLDDHSRRSSDRDSDGRVELGSPNAPPSTPSSPYTPPITPSFAQPTSSWLGKQSGSPKYPRRQSSNADDLIPAFRGESGIPYDAAEIAADASTGFAKVKQATPRSLHRLTDGQEEMVTKLLTAGADINSRDVVGNTPLINACMRGQLSVARALLRCGADAAIVNLKGQNALHLLCRPPDAAAKGALAQELMAAGLRPDAPDLFGNTAMKLSQQDRMTNLKRCMLVGLAHAM